MSRLDDIIDYADEFGSIRADEARAELAALRADLATAQRERDEARAQLREIDELIAPLDGQTLLEAVSYMIHDDGEPLTPRRCVTCARDAAREMREAVVKHCKDLANRTDICREAIDTKRNRMVRGEHIIYENLAAYFNSLPLPAECADCNPLKPESEATR